MAVGVAGGVIGLQTGLQGRCLGKDASLFELGSLLLLLLLVLLLLLLLLLLLPLLGHFAMRDPMQKH